MIIRSVFRIFAVMKKDGAMEIRPYSKSELAQMYAPELGAGTNSALNRLSVWINRNPELLQALERSGYTKNQRLFTSYQVRLIFEYLGEP